MHKHVEFCAVRLSQQQPASAGRIAVHAKPAVYKRSPARSVSAQSLKDRLIGLREAIESIEASIDHAVKML
jgi:hypothetical protein